MSRPPGAAVRASFALPTRGHAISKSSVPASGSNKQALPMLRQMLAAQTSPGPNLCRVLTAQGAVVWSHRPDVVHTAGSLAATSLWYNCAQSGFISDETRRTAQKARHNKPSMLGTRRQCALSNLKVSISGGCPEVCINRGGQGFGCKVRRGGAQEDKNLGRGHC